MYFGTDFEIINNASTLYVFAGNLRIAKMTDTGTEYYHKDHLGSTNAISGADGIVLATGEYLPYGSDRSTNALLNRSAYKFTDQEQDAGTGLYNYDARLYDPVLGQFVMADTIVPEPFNPQSLNRYAYCLNNPVRYVDPTGHITIGGYNFGTTGAWGNNNQMGENGSDAALTGAKGPVMTFCGWALPYSQPYSIRHDKWMDDLEIENLGLKAVTNVVIVVAIPTLITIDVWDFFFGKPTIDTTPYTTNELNDMLDSIIDRSYENNVPDAFDPMSFDPKDSDRSDTNNSGGTDNCGEGSATIICTELYRQGLMTSDIFKADGIFGSQIKKQNPYVMVGYHYLGAPLVRLMQKSKAVTHIVNIFATPWSYEMAYQVGLKQNGNIMGKIIMWIGIPICTVFGLILSIGMLPFCASIIVFAFALRSSWFFLRFKKFHEIHMDLQEI